MTGPHDDLILFDGVCNLCNASVKFVIRHDRRNVFKFVHIQSPLGRTMYKEAGLDPDEPESFMVLSQGHSLTRSDAVLQIFRRFGGLWRLLTVFKMVPRSWRDAAYVYIAKRRYRWFGRVDACLAPSESVRAKFLG